MFEQLPAWDSKITLRGEMLNAIGIMWALLAAPAEDLDLDHASFPSGANTQRPHFSARDAEPAPDRWHKTVYKTGRGAKSTFIPKGFGMVAAVGLEPTTYGL